jgi:hypothetical protein
MLSWFAFHCVNAQTKAYVLLNHWTNELDDYSDQQYMDKLFVLLKSRLPVKEIITSAESKTGNVRLSSPALVREHIQSKYVGTTAYFIVMDHYLKVPILNVGKVLFGNGSATSKYIFAINVYNSDGVQTGSDTIVSRGCIVSVPDKVNGVKTFYNSYKRFMDDMDCHLAAIRKQLLLRPPPKQVK